ncbi:hypothetical protein TNCV_4958351 [Trichonephila clavipes]|nr:hypothetical protein TNCV_4958351 [Trichonephila clavipes]
MSTSRQERIKLSDESCSSYEVGSHQIRVQKYHGQRSQAALAEIVEFSRLLCQHSKLDARDVLNFNREIRLSPAVVNVTILS